jgi:phosphate uptake regulator
VISNERILPERKGWIRHAVDNLVGVEISEEYSDRVVLQNLVDPLKFDLSKSMERFSATSLAVLADGVRAFVDEDLALAQDAFERGYQSTRLYRLLMRLAIQVVRNRKLREELNGQDIDDALMNVMAIKELGRMAYYAMRVAEHVREVDGRPDPAVLTMVSDMGRTTGEMQQRAFEAYMKRDFGLASSVIERMDEVRRLYDAITLHTNKTVQPRTGLAMGLMVRGIRGIAGYAVALADDAVLAAFE